MKKFISIFVLILVIIGLAIGVICCCKTIVNKNKENTELAQEINNLKETINNLNNTINNLDKENNNQIQEEIPNEKIDISFDESKIENKEENTNVVQKISDSMSVLSIDVNTEDNSLVLNLDKELAKLIYGYTGNGETHTITGFSQKIIDAQTAMVGTSQSDLKVVLLMNDGTLKYLDINSILDKSYSIKTIDDKKDFVKIVKVTIKDNERATVNYGIVGIKSDGTSEIIEL